MGLVWFEVFWFFFYLGGGFFWQGLWVWMIWGFFGNVSISPSKKSVQIDVGSLRNVLCNCYHIIFRGHRGLS